VTSAVPFASRIPRPRIPRKNQFFKDLKDEAKAKKTSQKLAAGVATVKAKLGGKKAAATKTAKKAKSAVSGHRGEVVDSFVRAHAQSFVCSSWVLLFPCVLSHTDLNWLVGELRAQAVTEAKTRTGLPADIDKRIKACAIEFLDGDSLNDFLLQYLDVAAKHLPRSSLALATALNDERSARDRDRDDVVNNLHMLRDDAVRARDAESRRAKAALSILNQGWGNLTGMLQAAIAGQNVAGKTFADIGVEVERHASDRSVHAYACEGLVQGASQLVAEILYQARTLQQVALFAGLGLAAPGSEVATAQGIVQAVLDLQRELGRVSRLIA
jgi:hypothetical protein